MVAGNVIGLTNGIYLYEPGQHALISTAAGDFLPMLSRAALGQEALTQVPAVFVIGGIAGRITGKYGDRGVRYMHMESGHAAQNICLQAVALEFDSVTIGAFTDNEVAIILKMEQDMKPLYIIPMGKAN